MPNSASLAATDTKTDTKTQRTSSADTESDTSTSYSFSSVAPSQSYYEQWFRTDLRKQEIRFVIQDGLNQIHSKYSFQRLKGLRKLFNFLQEMLVLRPNAADKELFNLIHKDINNETHIVCGIINGIFNNKSHNSISPVTLEEKYWALLAIEGACLISPTCSTTLATQKGFKHIIALASDPKLTFDPKDEEQLEEMQEEEIQQSPVYDLDDLRQAALDTIEAAIHNCTETALAFAEDSGIDSVLAMIRDKELNRDVRAKCVEVVSVLMKILHISSKSDKGTAEALKKVTDRSNLFLGNKLTEELKLLQNSLFVASAVPMVIKEYSPSPTTSTSITAPTPGSQVIVEAGEPPMKMDYVAFDKFIEKLDTRVR